jgi:hypothetical protein
MKDLRVEQLLFTEPFDVYTNVYPKAEEVKETLTQIITNAGDAQYRRTNVQANMTAWDMYSNEHFIPIIDWVIETLKEHDSPASPLKTSELYPIDCWGVNYKKGDSTNQHAHWPASYSFTYYVDACPKCASLVFPGAYKAIKPNTGLVIIFPGAISHLVPKQECDHNRICISGNLGWKVEQANTKIMLDKEPTR